MAKAKKVSGVKVFLTDEEASNLYMLLYKGVDYATRDALRLDEVQNQIGQHAPWKSVDFAQKASLTVPDEG